MREFGEKFSLAESTISGYENETRKPDIELFEKFADFFGVSTDQLLGRDKTYYSLTESDEKDIAKDLERMLADLESNESLAFNGEPMDEETKRLFAISLENSMRLAKEMAKKKFTPKKYRD
ncbi:hypothetical protein E6C60_1983 [Paenibacillus algicola]|uniref:HTH cro/C1-type domain-containing protein n=2 Tax=Paenibacillus algicola TaxID=2565926 RepID=A0A4P8XJX5_9BACL|nr:hypothetical protein E6C60_1983 [Paenibacillus algicola]